MKQVVIENPILNSPFEEPRRHFKFTEDGITDEIVEDRRVSQYLIPIPRPKKKSPKQLSFETQWTADRIEENRLINQIRGAVAKWRKGGYIGITKTSSRLLEYWKRPERERKLFFCQIEALETAIWIAEVAGKYGEAWIENRLREYARSNSTDDIACWFIDTDYNEETFIVRHAYFTGADEPYEKLKHVLRAEIDESAWSALYSTISYLFEKPKTGKIVVKVINHYGDEVLKVYAV